MCIVGRKPSLFFSDAEHGDAEYILSLSLELESDAVRWDSRMILLVDDKKYRTRVAIR